MAEALATDWHGDGPDLLVASTTWDRLLTALQEDQWRAKLLAGPQHQPVVEVAE